MKKLIFGLFLAVSLPAYGQGVNRCIDSIYAAYLANYTSPTPAQKASSLQIATKQCKAMAGLISDTGLVWSDTLTYLATKSNIATSSSGWQLAGNTLPGIKYLGSTNNVNWSMIVNGTVQATLTGSGITLNDGAAISTGTTVGSTFGNATNQRISFYGYTPIVQPTGDVLAALSSLGLVNSPTLPSGTGTVTSVATSYGITGGTITTSGTLTADTSKLSTIATARRLADSAAASVSTGGTVTSVGSGYSLSGGPVTGSGTLYVDSNYSTSRGRSQKLIDSLAAYNAGHFGTGTVTNVGSGYGTNFTAITTTGNVVVDTIAIATRARVQKAIDSLNNAGGHGTVTSITGGYGLNGGTITTSGTLSTDTTKTATIATARRLADSAAASLASGGTVTSIATTSPITGGTITSTGTIGIQVANTSQSGYLTSTDWNTFNGKQGAITLTTTGTSGAATFTSNTLNIPNYGSASMVSSITASRGITASGSTGAVTLAMDTTGAYTWTGAQTLQQNSIGSTVTNAIVLTNTTTATSGNPQYSPAIDFHGQGYNTVTPVAQNEDWKIYEITLSNTNPVSLLSFNASHAGGAFVEIMNLQRSQITLEQPVVISTTNGITMGGKVSYTTGSNRAYGTGTLSGGTATISNTNVTSTSHISITYTSCSNCAFWYISNRSAGVSFTITSTNASDASSFTYVISQ